MSVFNDSNSSSCARTLRPRGGKGKPSPPGGLRDSESGRTRVNWSSSKPSTRSRPAFEAGSFVEVRVSAILSVPLKRRRPLERGGTGLGAKSRGDAPIKVQHLSGREIGVNVRYLANPFGIKYKLNGFGTGAQPRAQISVEFPSGTQFVIE